MEDKCVLCGEADEGKPLNKKLGNGEYNVEVFEALRDLQLISIAEASKTNNYICWDCDETIVGEYSRYVENESKKQSEMEKNKEKTRREMEENKEKKRMERNERRRQRRAELKRIRNEIVNDTAPLLSQMKPQMKPVSTGNNDNKELSKTKQREMQRAANVYHSNHCMLCGNSFDRMSKGYLRFSLKKMIIDSMDVANVMEALGLARHIAPNLKNKRFLCSGCFYTIRRNYKTKLRDGPKIETNKTVPIHNTAVPPIPPIQRSTTNEHAKEIAKLLPPGLAECYKIISNDVSSPTKMNNKTVSNSNYVMDSATAKVPSEATVVQGVHNNQEYYNESKLKNKTTEGEEDDLNLSHDEEGNYFLNLKSSPNEINKSKSPEIHKNNNVNVNNVEVSKKKNVLLPKRNHHHAVENSSSTSSGTMEIKIANDSKRSFCNICGRSYYEKPDDWWHNLNSPLTDFESITVRMALQVLDTVLAETDEQSRLAGRVCLPCYGMVSSGFRKQLMERIARQKNIDVSQVNLSKLKVRHFKKEHIAAGKENEVNKLPTPVTEVANHQVPNDSLVEKKFEQTSNKRKASEENEYTNSKKPKYNDTSTKDNLKYLYFSEQNKNLNKSCNYKSNYFEDSYFGLSDSNSELDAAALLASSDPSYELDESDTDTRKRKKKLQKKKPSSKKVKRKTAVESDVGNIKKHSPNKAKSLNSIKQTNKPNTKSNSIESHNLVNQSSTKPLTENIESELLPRHDFNDNKVKEELPNRDSQKKRSKDENFTRYPNYDFESNCELYFLLSKMKEVKVVLKDLKHILPKEALDGRTLNICPINRYGYYVKSDESVSQKDCPLQYILNSWLPSKNFVDVVNKSESFENMKYYGRCVVCSEHKSIVSSCWSNISDYIDPPSLMVPLRWVCASLDLAPVRISKRERDAGKVCHICVNKLSSDFNKFVRNKIGESMEIKPEEVIITDYTVTFNEETMNIEADPVDLTPEEEIVRYWKIILCNFF